jgi:hypothetical protein
LERLQVQRLILVGFAADICVRMRALNERIKGEKFRSDTAAGLNPAGFSYSKSDGVVTLRPARLLTIASSSAGSTGLAR